MDRPTPDREMEENSEQADAGAQAQDVADDAVTRSIDLSEDSERGGRFHGWQPLRVPVPG